MNSDDATQFARACEGMTDGVYTLDLSTGRLLANPGFFSMLGYTPDELPSTLSAWTELLHPDDRDTVLAVLAEYETGRSGHALDIRLRTKNAEWRSVLHRGRLAQDVDGRLPRIVGIQVDVTEQARSVEALRDGEAQWRTFFDAAPEGLAMCEMVYAPDGTPQDYRLLALNPAYSRYTGLALPDTIGRTGSDISGATPPPHLEVYDRVATRNDAAEYDTPGETPGRQFRVAVFALGEHRFATAMRDITDRQRAAAAFAQRIRQLEHLCRIAQELVGERERTALLDLIAARAAELLRAGTATVFVWDEETGLLRTCAWHGSGPWRQGGVFRLGESVAGVAAAQQSGLVVNDFRESPFAHPFFLKQSSATAVIAEPLVQGDRLLGVLTCDNEGTGRPFTPADESALKLLATLARRALGSLQAEESRKQAEQARARRETLRALGDMADGVAHDLNNRFAAIVGFVELLKLRGSAPEGLERLESAIAGAVAVIRRFQGFARQRSTARVGSVDLRAAVDEVLREARTRWEELRDRHTIQVQCTLDDLPLVLGDASEIREVLTNIISNAVEAMPEGGTLTFAGGAGSTKAAILHISDTGVGMTEAVRQKVFEPFFTTKGGRGSGLGLSIAYGIMERHAGRIDVASTLGRGTTVTLQFQRAPAPVPSAESVPIPDQPSGADTVLVVAEEARARESLVGLLRAAGLMVTEASGRAAALRALATADAKVVLVDAPRMQRSTEELVQAIKGMRAQVPVVLLGHLENAGTSSAPPKGVDRMLPKSAPLEDLLRIIRELSEGVPASATVPPSAGPLRPMSHRA